MLLIISCNPKIVIQKKYENAYTLGIHQATKDSIFNGKASFYREDGSLWCVANFKEGKGEGHLIFYDKSSKKAAEGYGLCDKNLNMSLRGKWTYYDKNGKKEAIKYPIDDEFNYKKVVYFHPNGKKKEVLLYDTVTICLTKNIENLALIDGMAPDVCEKKIGLKSYYKYNLRGKKIEGGHFSSKERLFYRIDTEVDTTYITGGTKVVRVGEWLEYNDSTGISIKKVYKDTLPCYPCYYNRIKISK